MNAETLQAWATDHDVRITCTLIRGSYHVHICTWNEVVHVKGKTFTATLDAAMADWEAGKRRKVNE